MTNLDTTTSTRPTAFEHLPKYQQDGHHVATIESSHLVRYPSLGQHLLAALAEAERLGLTVKNGQIEIPLTNDEIDQRIATAQRNWDTNEAEYLAAVADPTAAKFEAGWRRNQIDAWAKAEQLPAVQWPVDAPAVTR